MFDIIVPPNSPGCPHPSRAEMGFKEVLLSPYPGDTHAVKVRASEKTVSKCQLQMKINCQFFCPLKRPCGFLFAKRFGTASVHCVSQASKESTWTAACLPLSVIPVCFVLFCNHNSWWCNLKKGYFIQLKCMLLAWAVKYDSCNLYAMLSQVWGCTCGCVFQK